MAQQLKIYTDDDNYKYFALYAYGMPREVVKTNQEMRDSKMDGSGIMRRHHTTKYDDGAIGTEGYNNNQKMSFAFLIAPYNVDENGNELKDPNNQKKISWYEASGWDISTDSNVVPDPWTGAPKATNTIKNDAIVNPTPTGCAAYTGPNQNDTPGTWRLPTQREAQMMFTIMEQALTMQGANDVTNLITTSDFWTSTELQTSSHWRVWYIDYKVGSAINTDKIDAWGNTDTKQTRCVRDIMDDPINE